MLDKFDNILVVEDHLIDGGFVHGLWNVHQIATPPKIIPMSIESNTVGKVAQESTLLSHYLLTLEESYL